MKRITSIDATRGLVMLIMAIDHTRDLVHFSAMTQDPLNLQLTTFSLFATRWITHLCAPTFVFLSGVSAYLAFSQSKDPKSSRLFLIKRGIWLVILEFTIVNFSVWFDVYFRTIILQVIAAIGFGFIFLSLFVNLSAKQNLSIAIVLILICNVVVGFNFPELPVANFFYHWLASPAVFQPTANFTLFVGYPVLPWFGIMLAGYGCGILFSKPAEVRSRLILQIGGAMLGTFIVLRVINAFGDPILFAVQKDAVFTFLSFINVSKYPPSLQYTLITLSVSFFFLFLCEKTEGKWKEFLSVYGNVPMLYYLLHFPMIHLAAEAIFLIQGYSWSDLHFGPFQVGRPIGNAGVGLVGVYLIWLAIIAILYPVCKGYAAYKKAHLEKAWLKYI